MSVRQVALAFLRCGGKRLRPRLCKAVRDAALSAHCKRAPAGDFDAIQEAVECFHKASLVHDDIQDGDEVRYGKPAIWKQYGIAVAIAVGDWLVAHGYQLIAQSGFVCAHEMLQCTVESHVQLCEGQGDELLALAEGANLSPRQATDLQRASVYQRKTGEAFALAAQLGALAADTDPTPYMNFARTYGVLFQVRDDRADGNLPPTSDTSSLALPALEEKVRQLLRALPAGQLEIGELLKI